MTRICFACLFVAGFAAALAAGEAESGKWTVMSDGIFAKLAADNQKVGYPGLSSGVGVDRATGEVYVVICDQGMWKSADHGATFARVDNKAIGGRCETGFALDLDPAGKRMMCFMIYGASALTSDAGGTWSGSKLSHLDFGEADWSETPVQTMIAVKHESGDEAVLSKDAGKSWTSLGKGFKGVGIFPGGVLMGSKGGALVRSEDGGANWAKVADIKPTGLAMRTSNGLGFWTSDAGVLASKDAGRTWVVMGNPVKAYYGPYFGKTDTHFTVVGKDGISETTDAGITWKVVAPLPPDFKVGFTGPNFGWDPSAGIFYASAMGKPAYRFVR